MSMKLIIDTDPGIDDAMAIFYAAAAPDIELVGLTTVFGNVTTDIATRNALRLAEAARVDIPVAPGATKPHTLPPFPPTSRVHGDEGFGDIPAATPQGRALNENAADFLCRMARTQPGEITLCAIGPMTNVAAALERDPEFARNIKQIVMMGGSLEKGGNITPHAEANFYHDPHAAYIVCASGADVVMVGLDVTHQILCTAADFDTIAANAPELGRMLHDMSDFYLDFYQSVGKFDGCSLHDPAAVIACTHPQLFEMQTTAVEVVCDGDASGQSIPGPDNRAPIRVCMGVDSDAVKALFIDRLATLR